MEGVVIMSNVDKAALELHKENQGKLEIVSKVDLGSSKDLTLAYTPGVAAPWLEIKDDYNKLMGYKWNGNVRELYHFLDRIYAEEQRTLESERH